MKMIIKEKSLREKRKENQKKELEKKKRIRGNNIC
jgi:small nuclear ribonucleoprotein (snRNP)-like protein